jgi:hypothetical protein
MANAPCGHTILNLACEHCRTVFASWNNKLEEAGFVDIEEHDKLKSWHSYKFKKIDPTVREAKKAYFEAAQNLLLNYSFKDTLQKKIWELHCQGHSIRKIEELLLKSKLKKVCKRDKVNYTIRFIAREIKK